MELDTIMQIVFGIFTISIAVFGIWFAWHNTRGNVLGKRDDHASEMIKILDT
jgi:hypothetical protein